MSQDGNHESGDFSKIDKELEDIQENEVNEGDSESVARRPPSSSGSHGSNSSASKPKRRTWKKPKDKPKRPLSAYNIFFKHERSRIVEGRTEDATPEETIRSIENILSTSRETRRHRKTHGRISFGDLARKIAEKWKSIAAEQKAVFEHYAELDMRRYRQEVRVWKEKKEAEAYANKGALEFSGNSMSNSFSSVDSESDYQFENHMGASTNSDDAWAPRRNFYDSMNSSFSSACSVDSELSLEPIPIGDMLRNARPNTMHSSMPNLNMDAGVPGIVSSSKNPSMMGSQMDPMLQFGQQSMSSMNFSQNQSMPMDGQSMPMNSVTPQSVVSSGNPTNPMELHQLRQQNSLQQQQLQRQQQILMRQQQLLQQQLQQTTRMMNNVSMQKMQMAQDSYPMPQQNMNVLGDGSELDNYLSNLDM